jgi:two-component system, LuxR family, response regulator FixJ
VSELVPLSSCARLSPPSPLSVMDNDSTVFVVDSETKARPGILDLVKAKGLRAAGFESANEFLAEYDPTKKGCIVIDVPLGKRGLEQLQELKASKNSLPVVMMAGDADVPLAVRAMQEGAVSFLKKPCPDREVWEAISQALEVEKTQHLQRKERAETQARLQTMSDDELEVFRRLLAGQANKRIASDLDIGLRTVELRRSNIMKKMQAASLPDLVRMAILVDFLKLEGDAA